MAASPMKTRISPKVCCSPGEYSELLGGRARKTCARENYFSMRGSKLLGPKKGKKKKRPEKLISLVCLQHFL